MTSRHSGSPRAQCYDGRTTLCTPPESRRDQEEGGELDSHEEVRLSCAGPDEINRRAVSCRLLRLSFIEGPGRETD